MSEIKTSQVPAPYSYDIDAEVSVDRKDEITHKIYVRAKTHCLNSLHIGNIHDVCVLVMRELNKCRGLFGFNKKQIALNIISLLVNEYGSDELKMVFNIQVVDDMIENIYNQGYHRKMKCCIIM